MIKVENIDVWGFEHAIRGMRNPMNSWSKSDSYMCDETHCPECKEMSGVERNCNRPDGYVIGPNDLSLMKKLFAAGTEHRKYLRQIFVSMDITAPLYWWKEWDTYKHIAPDPLPIDSNSCSTMHKLLAKEFELDDFSHEYMVSTARENLISTIDMLNDYRAVYRQTSDEGSKKQIWYQILQSIPSSYNQKRTVTLSYETVADIIRQRKNHKLDEWRDLVRVMEELPYAKELMEQ